MARAFNRLSARQAETLKTPGRHSDGGNLYLSISKTGSRRWVFLYRLDGRQREMGLGAASKNGVSLATARALAQNARDSIAVGKDPLELKVAVKRSARIGKTFGVMADEHIKSMRPSWKNAKHAAQWTYTLKVLAAPLQAKRVDEIETSHVLEVLKPLWNRVPETASRVRSRIENVLDAARASGHRQGENPARWRGHLDKLLARRAKHTRTRHAALPYPEVPQCVGKLRSRKATAALALEVCILTATRTGETIGAQWSEFDFDKALWIIPSARMKAGTEHRVPLAPRALKILKGLHKLKMGAFVFPGSSPRKPLSNMAMAMLLRRLGYDEITVHGFRSAFKDWASEATNFPHQVSEAALAHTIANKTEAAYSRSDLLVKRAKLMSAWADYCEPEKSAKVIPITQLLK